ncbi:hypothetical protein GQ457_13G009420 [Hibiscus cannabinus]
MYGDLIVEKISETMKCLYHRRGHGESGSIDMEDMENKLVAIKEKINQYLMKDIFNMDEIGLFYRLQADHYLATKQLEGIK